MYSRKEFYKLFIETNGNPSTEQLTKIGIKEGNAVEMVTRMTAVDREKLVAVAKKLYESEVIK